MLWRTKKLHSTQALPYQPQLKKDVVGRVLLSQPRYGKKAKSWRSESVTIPKSFEPILIEMGIDELPKDYYIFFKNFELQLQIYQFVLSIQKIVF